MSESDGTIAGSAAAQDRSWIGLMIIGALVLLWLAAHYPLLSRWRIATLLETEGVTTLGTVSDRSVSYPKTGRTYHLDYSYRADGQHFSVSEVVDQSVWDSADIGARVRVMVARSDPRIAAIAPRSALDRAIIWYALMDGLLLLLAIGGGIWRSRSGGQAANQLGAKGSA